MKNKISVLIVDANYHSNLSLYKQLITNNGFIFTVAISTRQVFEEEKIWQKFCQLIILNPTLPDHGHYGGPDATKNGRLTGLFLYRDKFEHLPDTKVIVWARSEDEALERWGDNVIERIIIPNNHFCFLEVVKKHFHFV